MKMTAEDFYWLLWGIGVAFVLQVFYDGLGQAFPTQKVNIGFVIMIVYFAVLILYGFCWKYMKRRSTQERRELAQTTSILPKLEKMESENSPSKSRYHHPDIDKLIKIVDDNFEKRKYCAYLNDLTFWSLIIGYIFVFLGVGGLLYLVLSPAQISSQVFISLVSVVIAFIALQISSAHSIRSLLDSLNLIVDYNFHGMKNKEGVGELDKPFLKALIVMKSKHPDLMLERLIGRKLIGEDRLLEKLYE